MKTSLISIVIPTFQRSHLLPAAVASALNQTYPSTEIIVVDDNGEGSPGQLRSYSNIRNYIDNDRIRYISHQKRQGGSAARNSGIDKAEGKYVAFLDDDDTWDQEKLEKQFYQLQNADENTGLVYCGVYLLNPDQEIERSILPDKKGYILNDLLFRNHIRSTSCILVYRNLLIQSGLFDEKLPIRQDIDLYIRLARICKFDFVNEPLVFFNKYNEERVSHNTEKRIETNYIIFNKYNDIFLEYAKAYSHFHYMQGKLYLKIQDKINARKHFKSALKAKKTNFRALGKLLSLCISRSG